MNPANILPAATGAATQRTTAGAADATATDDARGEQAQRLFYDRVAEARFSKLVLARPQAGAEPDLQRVVLRPIELRGVPHLSFVYSHATRDVTKNLPLPEALARLRELLPAAFRNAHLLTATGEVQLVFSKRGKASLIKTRVAAGAAQAADAAVAADAADAIHASATEPATGFAAHDREKQRWLDLTSPFLVALGVTNAQHQLVPAMSRKWKQINKFVEIFAHALDHSRLADAAVVKVADFGAGRGYLTFAIHDWLQNRKGVQPQVTGVELRADLVREAQAHIQQLGLQGLQFEAGNIMNADTGAVRDAKPGAMNVMIALHACDTATDHAIHLGLRAGADIILCSPCCHKQIRPQLLSPHPLRPVFQHGIHAEQQAEMLTDSLRALLLEASGYDTQVFEFIALEHTRKNKMILAIKRKTVKPADAAWAQVDALKRYFGIREQALETLLKAEAAA